MLWRRSAHRRGSLPQTLLIPGTRSIDHLEENLAVGDVMLDEEALAALEG